jgi:hypothetical protein
MSMKKVTITIESEDFKYFKTMCERNGYKISTRLALIIKRDIDRDKKDLSFQRMAR